MNVEFEIYRVIPKARKIVKLLPKIKQVCILEKPYTNGEKKAVEMFNPRLVKKTNLSFYWAIRLQGYEYFEIKDVGINQYDEYYVLFTTKEDKNIKRVQYPLKTMPKIILYYPVLYGKELYANYYLKVRGEFWGKFVNADWVKNSISLLETNNVIVEKNKFEELKKYLISKDNYITKFKFVEGKHLITISL